MQAANEGAREAQATQRVQSIGIRVELPFEQEANPFVEQAFEHQSFFTRLHQFVLMSDAYVVAPGGIGTVLESMMITASVVVGDSVWDLLAARRARALGVGLLSGGYGQEELERAGAYRVYEDPADLLEHLDEIGVRSLT
jgi:phosphoglycolate phosphatase-like HAD superfamily hydrolase